MEKLQQQNTTSWVLSIFTLLLMIIIVILLINVLFAFIATNSLGRCVYLDTDTNECICELSSKSRCNSLNGIYQSNITCQDGFTADCIRATPKGPRGSCTVRLNQFIPPLCKDNVPEILCQCEKCIFAANQMCSPSPSPSNM